MELTIILKIYKIRKGYFTTLTNFNVKMFAYANEYIL